jgi:hypothetical protein
MNNVIAIIQNILDWLSSKAESKYGLAIIGFVFGLVTPLAHVYYQDKRIEDLIQSVAEEKANTEFYKASAKEWEQRSFEAEQKHIEKTREMVQLMNDLEVYYKERNSNQDEINKNLNAYLHRLNCLASKIDNENDTNK